jgi:hypothetical protein
MRNNHIRYVPAIYPKRRSETDPPVEDQAHGIEKPDIDEDFSSELSPSFGSGARIGAAHDSVVPGAKSQNGIDHSISNNVEQRFGSKNHENNTGEAAPASTSAQEAVG